MRRIVIAFFILASPAVAADKWTGIQTKNFLLMGNASERRIRDVGENLEQSREAVSRLLPRAKTTARCRKFSDGLSDRSSSFPETAGTIHDRPIDPSCNRIHS